MPASAAASWPLPDTTGSSEAANARTIAALSCAAICRPTSGIRPSTTTASQSRPAQFHGGGEILQQGVEVA